MNIVTELNEINELLNSYAGAKFQIKGYTDSLQKIVIRLAVPDRKEVLYMVAVGCRSVSGLFSFSGADIEVSKELAENKLDVLITVKDKSGNFLLQADAGLGLAKGLESEFGDIFGDFLKGK
ncbi:hypothetical protein KTO58_10185 [Chitinophaga pendula]|uniref:hypothetical protein n=1 Tax=Chitinophaga TaxID=79328 RepID=UPI000BAF2627|nr:MULTISPECIES: hypothetical protein [Chitinophaga]ASZ12844.1 hypothetical protein CK934_18720 [Chitinophaga sp. MD30]UCJ09531.1 hypothetical protein KTO58_10185 [Chitinophaga pendula]